MDAGLVEKVATALRTGLVHPGDERRDATVLRLPVFDATGRSPDEVKLAAHLATTIAEAVIAVIETDHEIVDRTEVTQLRDEQRPVEAATKVTCRRCGQVLLALAVRGAAGAQVDGRQLLTGLAARSADCPHGTA